MAGKYQSKDRPRSVGGPVWGAVRTGFTWLLMIAAVAMMIFTVVSVNTFDRNDRSLFGYKAYIVRSDSMKATDFSAGDLVLVKQVDPARLQAGDIISFQSTNAESYGKILTHKIRRVTTDPDGNPAFVTYGTTTGQDDDSTVAYGNVRGKYQFAIPYVGTFFEFLKTTPGYIVCIFLPFLLLIGLQGIQSVKLFKQYKDEQLAQLEARRRKEMEEMAAEREKLAQERAESQKLLSQLQKLQAQLIPEPPEDPE